LFLRLVTFSLWVLLAFCKSPFKVPQDLILLSSSLLAAAYPSSMLYYNFLRSARISATAGGLPSTDSSSPSSEPSNAPSLDVRSRRDSTIGPN